MNSPILDVYTTPLAGHTLIEASAGTGKTWTISGLYTRLLLDQGLNLQVSEILVVTFTLAATAELRDRIRKRLSDVLDSFRSGVGVDEFCQRLLDRFDGDVEWAIRKLTRAVSSFDDAAIFTIHGFCQRILGEAAFESGADFGLEMLPDQSELLSEVVEDFWRREIYPADGAWLEYLQQQGASPESWRKLVAPLLGTLPRQILPLATLPDLDARLAQFQREVAQAAALWRQHQAQIRDLLLNDAGLNRRSYAVESLRPRLERLDALIAADGLASELLRSASVAKARDELARFGAEKIASSAKKGCAPLQHAFFDSIDILLAQAAELAPAFDLRLQYTLAELLRYIETELPKRKHERQQMSFDDLLHKVWQATRGEQGAHFTAFIRSRYRAALIDEFQDTDPVQCGIFEAAYAGTGLPLFFVGDPKQAIYSFRGADIHAYLAARRGVDRSATLDTNQRSVPLLIEAVNQIFGNGANPAAFVDPGIEFQPVHAAHKPRQQLHIEGEDAAPMRFLLLPGKADESGEKTRSASEAGEMATEGTANNIARLLTLAAQGKAWLQQGELRQPLTGGDIAVLVPSNWRAREMQQALLARGIASVRQVRESVFESEEAQSLLLVLSAIAAPTRQGVVRTALVSPLMGFTVSMLMAAMEQGSEWESWLDQFSRWHELWRDNGFMRMLRDWLDWAGAAGQSVAERLLAQADGERRLTNLLHLAELLQQESRQRSGIEPLLAWFDRAVNDPQNSSENTLVRLESDASRVQIVTIHSSKGLEYPLVFCPWLWEGRLNGGGVAVSFHQDDAAWLDFGSARLAQHRQLAALESLQEKLRLLYVALTRAKHRCYIVWGNVDIKPALDGAASAEDLIKGGFHSSPLSWLLHPCPSAGQDDPIRAMRQHCAGLDTPAIVSDLQKLRARAPDAFAISALPLEFVAAPPPQALAQTLVPAQFRQAALRWGWRVASFSGLTHGSHAALPSEQLEAPDYDAQAEPLLPAASISREPSVFNFPLGEVPASVAGTTIHAVLENWDWDDAALLPQVVQRELETAGIQPRWQQVVEQMACDTVATRLDRRSLCLQQASKGQRLAEMEFTFPLDGLSVAAVQRLLEQPQYGVDPAFAAAARSLSFDSLRGYMRGFIDLVFEVDGRYYIVDYKTNRLGNTLQDYDAAALTQAMAHSHYYLQYLIYSVAVHRHLASRLPGYDYQQHFGGVYYLFLRGMGDHSGHYGVFADRLSLALIQAFEALLQQGVAA